MEKEDCRQTPAKQAAVETLLKYGDVARGNLEAPINPRFKEYLE